jgi:hypothetical protein
MKKTVLILIFIYVSVSLSANVFIDMYHKNYVKIDRTVLVFDSKPKYRIIENDYDIQLNISNCKKDINIQNLSFSNNDVIESYDYYSTEDKVMVIITIDQSHDLETNIKYRLDVFEDESTYFRLILDVFATNTPKTYHDYVGFAAYYEETNRPEMAMPYREMVHKLEAEMPELAQQPVVEQQVVESKNIFQTIITPGRIVLILIVLLLLAALIYLVHHFRKPQEIEEFGSLRELAGFGSNSFRKSIIDKLKEYAWNEKSIALEMEIEPDNVIQIIHSDLDVELEGV